MKVLKLFTVSMLTLTIALSATGRDLDLDVGDLEKQPGHLKAFGAGRPSQEVKEVDSFPSPEQFFENYVIAMKPVLMKGAANMSKAFTKWTDEYFLSENSDFIVYSEASAKQELYGENEYVTFTQFTKRYKENGHYMINNIPPFLRKDIVIPCCIQCPVVTEESLNSNVMWFSNGGTNGSVHVDAVENILCSYRGTKQFTMIDPATIPVVTILDGGAYSEMDPDRVDFTKYPTMATVEYWTALLRPGDCLFVPYKWIHQVRSTGNNLGISIWWNHYLPRHLDYSTCNQPCDTEMTFDDVTFDGNGELLRYPLEVRDDFITYLKNDPSINEEDFVNYVLGVHGVYKSRLATVNNIHWIFEQLDHDKNGDVTRDEINSTSNEMYVEFGKALEEFEGELDEVLQQAKQADINPHTEL